MKIRACAHIYIYIYIYTHTHTHIYTYVWGAETHPERDGANHDAVECMQHAIQGSSAVRSDVWRHSLCSFQTVVQYDRLGCAVLVDTYIEARMFQCQNVERSIGCDLAIYCCYQVGIDHTLHGQLIASSQKSHSEVEVVIESV
jgi:hypothetical protein